MSIQSTIFSVTRNLAVVSAIASPSLLMIRWSHVLKAALPLRPTASHFQGLRDGKVPYAGLDKGVHGYQLTAYIH